MKTRLLAIAFCILVLPCFGTTDRVQLRSPGVNTVVFAGHTQSGTWCDCGTAGCLCDPGEVPNQTTQASNPNSKPAKKGNNSGADLLAAGLAALIILFLSARLRP